MAFVFYHKMFFNWAQNDNNFHFSYLITLNEMNVNAKKFPMLVSDDEKIISYVIVNDLKLGNLKVKNKEKKLFVPE